MKKIAAAIVSLGIAFISTVCAFAECENVFKHTTEYKKKGSRSEIQQGILYIKGKETADTFTVILGNTNAYAFFQRKNLWGKEGYFPVELSKMQKLVIPLEKDIDSASITRGWYSGNTRYTNTPECWLFVKWNNGSAFVDPEKVSVIIDHFNLKTIPRVVPPKIKMLPKKGQ